MYAIDRMRDKFYCFSPSVGAGQKTVSHDHFGAQECLETCANNITNGSNFLPSPESFYFFLVALLFLSWSCGWLNGFKVKPHLYKCTNFS